MKAQRRTDKRTNYWGRGKGRECGKRGGRMRHEMSDWREVPKNGRGGGKIKIKGRYLTHGMASGRKIRAGENRGSRKK